MKIIIKICLFCSVLISVCLNQPTMAEGNYPRNVLINFTWGDGNYQLGTNYFQFFNDKGEYKIPPDAGSEVQGPNAIKVDHKGNIYVLDTINSRLLQFDHLGKYRNSLAVFNPSPAIGIDSSDNLYLEYRGSLIEVYSPKLKLLQTINYGPYNNFPNKIWVDETRGIIYLESASYIYQVFFKKVGQQIKNQGVNYEIKESTKFAKTIPYINVQKDFTEIKVANIFDRSAIEIRIMNNQTSIIRGIEVVMLMRDCLYLLATESGKDLNNFVKRVYLYDFVSPKIILTNEITLDRDEYMFYAQEDQNYLIDIDQSGSIYHLWIQKQGAKLVKWEKQN